jgi:hypothetical protein
VGKGIQGNRTTNLVRHETKPVKSVKVIWSGKLKELKVGLRISREEGISFFGMNGYGVLIK